MFLTIACATLSLMVGIPRGRFLPFVLGIYTLFVGDAVGITQSLASFTRACGVFITSLSIPAVGFLVLT